jgi:hypothetical protein
MNESHITIDYVKSLNKPTDHFLCSLSDNIYDIKFLSFRVRDLDSGFTLFEVEDTGEREEIELPENDENRIIKYHLGSDFLSLTNLGTSLTFSVGVKPVKNLYMIERHYFKDKLIKSFEFKFDFCMPNSINNWETIYTIPELPEDLKEEMINCPWETTSDSFYFVDNNLIMHHKAYYNYSDI